MGPDAGRLGGRVVAMGEPEWIARTETVTAPFLATMLKGNMQGSSIWLQVAEDFSQNGYGMDSNRREMVRSESLQVLGAREHNLRNLNVRSYNFV